MNSVCFLAGLQLEGCFQDIDADQTTIVEKLKLRLENELQVILDFHTVVRFLVADNWCIELASTRLKETIAWRNERGVDDILSRKDPKTVEIVDRLGLLVSRRLIGVDKNNFPVYWENMGLTFHSDTLSLGTIYEWEIRLAFEAEEIQAACRNSTAQNLKNGAPKIVDSFVYIGDLTDLDFMSTMTAIDKIKQLSSSLERVYPEQLEAVYLINCPSYVTFFYAIAEKFMSPHTTRKVQIHHGIPSVQLLERMDADILPVLLGGSNAISLSRSFVSKREMLKVNVKSGGIHRIRLGPINVGCTLSWVWEIDGWLVDIAFRIKLESSKGNTMYLEQFKVSKGVGQCTCETDDSFVVFEFDNTDSLFRSKDISYLIEEQIF